MLRGLTGNKLHEAFAFLRHCQTIGLRQPSQGLDCQGSTIASSLDVPRGLDDTVDQNGARKDHVAVGVIDDAGAVVMADQYVVVLRQEPRWGGRIRIWQRPIRNVEEFAATLVLKRSQLRA